MKNLPKSLTVEFASITISFFIHSTEDSGRLLSNVTQKLGLATGELQCQNVEGYYGNEIISAKAHVIGKRAQEVATKLLGDLSPGAKKKVIEELDRSMDEHDALYLRIDRQVIDKEIATSDEEPIRIKLKPKFRVGGHNSMRESYEELIK